MQTYTVSEEVLEVTNLDSETLIEAATTALTRPAESYWSDSDLWDTHTLMFSTPAWWITEDYIVDQANYRAVLKELSEKYPNDVEDATFGHWTYSTYQSIKVRVVDENRSITKAFAEAFEIATYLKEQHPVYDEELLSQLETEQMEEFLDSIIEDIEAERAEQDWTATAEWSDRFKDYISERAYREQDVVDEYIDAAKDFADNLPN